MNLREYALGIVLAESMEQKLAPPDSTRGGLLDDEEATRGDGVAPNEPGRAPNIAIEKDTRKKRKVPPLSGFRDLNQRVRILHALANHELQAIELFAWAIVRFPSTPAAFRSGLLRILGEEQRHCSLYLDRLAALGGRFGDWPLSGYFWTRAQFIETPVKFICAMCLTFENANLDHALALEEEARTSGDPETADVLRIVHDDEVGHVRFGLHWLSQWKEPGQSLVDAWLANITFPLRPELARGDRFFEGSRRAVGFDDSFIALLAAASRPRALYHFDKSNPSERQDG